MRLRKHSKTQGGGDQPSSEDATHNPYDSSSDSESDDDMKELAAKTCQAVKETLGLTTKSNSSTLNVKKDNSHEKRKDLFIIDKSPGDHSSKDTVIADESDVEIEQQISTADEGSNKSRKKRRRKKKSLEQPVVKDPWALSSSLQVSVDLSDVYVNVNSYKNPGGGKALGNTIVLGKDQGKKMMQQSVMTSDFEKQHQVDPYHTSKHQLKKKHQAERDQTKGRGWFDMKAQEMTDEAKNDLMVLQMRRALDPKRFYKGPDIRALPKFFQMGRVMDSPLDFYSSRVPKKQRKKTLVDELMADAKFRQFNKRKYAEIVESKSQGRGAYKHMKRLKKNKKR